MEITQTKALEKEVDTLKAIINLKEIEASRYNKVNIDHLKEQVDNINKQIEKLRNGNH